MMPGRDIEVEAHSLSLLTTAEEVLRQRAESLARESIGEQPADLVSLLLFRLGHEWYAVHVEDVREIFQEYSVTPLPCVPDFVVGVVNVRGEILSVCDAARLMRTGSVEAPEGVTLPAIVIERDEVATALVVDEIGDIADVAQAAAEPPVSTIDRSHAEFVLATVEIGDSLVGLVNTARLLEPVSAQRH